MMKRKVQVKNNMITVDGHKIPILSGEVHYWRLNPNYWKEILDRVRDLAFDLEQFVLTVGQDAMRFEHLSRRLGGRR